MNKDMKKHQFKIKNLYRVNGSGDKITKDQDVDIADTKLFVEGFASHVAKDRVNDIVLPDAFEKSLPEFNNNPVLLFQHDQDQPIGKITETSITDEGLKVKAMISATRPDIQKLIEEGILSTFSIGFNPLEQDFDSELKANIIKDVELLEISVVTIPANPAAAFEMASKTVDELLTDSKSLISNKDKAEAYFGVALATIILAEYKGLKNNITYNNINEIVNLSCDKYELDRECLKTLTLNLRSDSVGKETDKIIREVLNAMVEKTNPDETKDKDQTIELLTDMVGKLDTILEKVTAAQQTEPTEVDKEAEEKAKQEAEAAEAAAKVEADEKAKQEAEAAEAKAKEEAEAAAKVEADEKAKQEAEASDKEATELQALEEENLKLENELLEAELGETV